MMPKLVRSIILEGGKYLPLDACDEADMAGCGVSYRRHELLPRHGVSRPQMGTVKSSTTMRDQTPNQVTHQLINAT